MAIFPCKCKSEFQDAEHGPGNRVWNYGKKIGGEGNGGGYRCTICGATRLGGKAEADAVKAEKKSEKK